MNAKQIIARAEALSRQGDLDTALSLYDSIDSTNHDIATCVRHAPVPGTIQANRGLVNPFETSARCHQSAVRSDIESVFVDDDNGFEFLERLLCQSLQNPMQKYGLVRRYHH